MSENSETVSFETGDTPNRRPERDIHADLEVYDAAPATAAPGGFWRVFLIAAAVGLIGGLGVVCARYVSNVRSAPASAAPPRLIPHADEHPMGANFFLAREVETWKRRKTLEMARDAGIHWVKQQFPWEALEPQSKGVFVDPKSGQSSWVTFDQFVGMADDLGLEIIARLDRPPAWTRQDNRYAQRPPDDFDDYGDFVAAFVRHYKGRIRFIQVWNEPNIFPEWGDQPVDPAAYAQLLRIAYTRAKEVDPDVVVLSAPLAITLDSPAGRRNMSDLDFLEALYQAGAKPHFDVLSANAFGMDLPPDDPPHANILNFRRVELQREIMVRNGDADKAVWLNEYGWNAAPETMPYEALPWKRVLEAQQAEYTVEGIRFGREHWPWVGVFNVWYFRQVGNVPPDRADYYFRLMDVDFTPRPVYLALQEASDEWRVAGPGTFEETNAAVAWAGDWSYHRVPAARAEWVMTSVTPGDVMTVTFRGPALDLLATRKPDAGILWVSLDGRPVDGLPRDDTGQSYVGLYAPQPAWQQRVPLVRGASQNVHALTLVVSNRRETESRGLGAEVDGFDVPPSPIPFPWWTTAVLLAALLLVGWLLWLDVRPVLRGG